jgi:hypothetical protein
MVDMNEAVNGQVNDNTEPMTPEVMMAMMRRPEHPSMSQAEMSLQFERLEAARTCENLAGRFSYYYTASRMRELCALFAHTADDRVTMPWGVYLGADAAERCFIQDMTDRDAEDRERVLAELGGRMMIPDLCTPIIEVAGDGQTARGLWISPGLEAHRLSEGSQGWWSWSKFGADFLRTEEGWKLVHVVKTMYFSSEYERDWASSPQYIWRPERVTADGPAPEWYYYSVDAVYPDEELAIPLPYKTWSEVAPGY